MAKDREPRNLARHTRWKDREALCGDLVVDDNDGAQGECEDCEEVKRNAWVLLTKSQVEAQRRLLTTKGDRA